MGPLGKVFPLLCNETEAIISASGNHLLKIQHCFD